MEAFERMLDGVRISVERFAHYRLPSTSDAEDVLQKVCLSAYRKFPQSKNKDSFQPWIISIAGNTCSDYFRAKGVHTGTPAVILTIPC